MQPEQPGHPSPPQQQAQANTNQEARAPAPQPLEGAAEKARNFLEQGEQAIAEYAQRIEETKKKMEELQAKMRKQEEDLEADRKRKHDEELLDNRKRKVRAGVQEHRATQQQAKEHEVVRDLINGFCTTNEQMEANEQRLREQQEEDWLDLLEEEEKVMRRLIVGYPEDRNRDGEAPVKEKSPEPEEEAEPQYSFLAAVRPGMLAFRRQLPASIQRKPNHRSPFFRNDLVTSRDDNPRVLSRLRLQWRRRQRLVDYRRVWGTSKSG